MALLTLILWWPLSPSPWLSPAAAWFIFFNAVVVAIAVMSTSGGASASAGASRRRLCRSGSSMFLDRLRSFFVFPAGHLPIDQTTAAHCCSREAAEAASSATQVRAPERNPRAVTSTTPGATAAIGTAQPSAYVATATAEDHAPPAPPTEEQQEEEEEEDNEEAEKEQDHDESISLDQAYALAQRHRAKPLASPPPAAAAASAAAAHAAALPTEHEKKKPAKVVADRRRVSKAGEALEGKAELNARAELFIRQFREDLRLQRLNSILKHTHALGSPTAAR